ncbi:DUF1772 domain-containing protein [filamentous cyanobacterium LEGE 11480]|uniref:DUF1772 domain-containing protein n=1 Tax=Romeriopsis navalis LEGE 11480 TaxID=2777977 RepID=A0A928Z6W1_9CYAN|nr:DUF1772 domain-containing protein [Romeriopsis navalis]MBE9033407.1 DUF1772 domain-containing protein [Romeriopsis navalis LEGE 11480]
MIGIESILLLSSAAILGIFLGAQIAEAYLFVPIWKEMHPNDFFEQHKSVGPRIYHFFAPLTIAATGIPLATVLIGLLRNSSSNVLFWIMGTSTLAFFSTYFLYFKTANQKFADRKLSNDELPDELQRWGNWHWTRIGFEAIAFGCSIILLLNK